MGSGGSVSSTRPRVVSSPPNSTPSDPSGRVLRVTHHPDGFAPKGVGRVTVPQRVGDPFPPPSPPPEAPLEWTVEDLDHPGEWEALPATVRDRLDAAVAGGQSTCAVVLHRRVCTVDLTRRTLLGHTAGARPRRVRHAPPDASRPVDPFLDPFLDADADPHPAHDAPCGASATTCGTGTRFPRLLRSLAAHRTTAFTLSHAHGAAWLSGTAAALTLWDTDGAVRVDYRVGEAVVLCAGFAPSGAALVAGTDTRVALLFAPDAADPRGTLSGHTHKVYGADFFPGEARVGTASMDGTARRWDAAREAVVEVVAVHRAPLFALANGRLADWRALVAGDGRAVCALDFRLGPDAVVARMAGHTRTVWACQWRGDEVQLVSAGMDGTVRVWDTRRTEAPLHVWRHHTKPVHFVEFAPNGRAVLSAGRDGTAQWVHAETGEVIWRAAAHAGSVFRARYDAETNVLATCGGDGNVNIWEYTNPDNW